MELAGRCARARDTRMHTHKQANTWRSSRRAPRAFASRRPKESGEEASGAQDVGDVGHGYNADGGSWILLEGVYRGDIVNDEVFEELRFRPEGIQAANAAWNGYVRSAETPELAGEALYAAIYDAAPNLQWMYKTPRAIMGMRYLRAFNGVMANLTDPKSLKASGEECLATQV